MNLKHQVGGGTPAVSDFYVRFCAVALNAKAINTGAVDHLRQGGVNSGPSGVIAFRNQVCLTFIPETLWPLPLSAGQPITSARSMAKTSVWDKSDVGVVPSYQDAKHSE